MEAEKILRLLRAGQNVSAQIRTQSGVLNERIVTRSGPEGYREEIEKYLAEVYNEAGRMLALDHEMRVSAELDAAQARAHWRRLRVGVLAILDKLEDDYPSSDACDDILRLVREHDELDGADGTDDQQE